MPFQARARDFQGRLYSGGGGTAQAEAHGFRRWY